MGLKGYRLWVMGQLDSNVQSPAVVSVRGGVLDVAAQVDPFERKPLKPVFHLVGARVETTRLSAVGQGESTCTGPPASASAPRDPNTLVS
jgi:hypothetical protein